jgi:hypothetical protein
MVGRCFLNLVVSAVSFLSLCGRGGKGRVRELVTEYYSGGSEGAPARACVRGAGRWLAWSSSSSASSPACLGDEVRWKPSGRKDESTLILTRWCFLYSSRSKSEALTRPAEAARWWLTAERW